MSTLKAAARLNSCIVDAGQNSTLIVRLVCGYSFPKAQARDQRG